MSTAKICGASGHLRRHHCAQADGAAAIHRDAGPECRLQAIEHGAGAGLDAASERAEQGQVHVLVDLDHIALVGHRVGAERGLAEERRQVGIALVQARAAVLHAPAEIQLVEEVAHGGVPGQAVGAMAAMGEGHHHVVADGEVGDVGADLFDDPGALVPQHDRIGRDGQVASHRIGMTDAGRDHLDEHLAGPGAGQAYFLDCERCALVTRYRCLDPHAHLRKSAVGCRKVSPISRPLQPATNAPPPPPRRRGHVRPADGARVHADARPDRPACGMTARGLPRDLRHAPDRTVAPQHAARAAGVPRRAIARGSTRCSQSARSGGWEPSWAHSCARKPGPQRPMIAGPIAPPSPHCHTASSRPTSAAPCSTATNRSRRVSRTRSTRATASGTASPPAPTPTT